MAGIKSLWLRELYRYPVEYIEQLLGRQTVNHLVQANIMRRVGRGEDDPDISEMMEVEPEGEPMLACKFCGLVLAGGYLLHIYPKYLPVGTKPSMAFWLAMRAIMRYQKHRHQCIDQSDRRSYKMDLFSTMLALLADYREYGLYRVDDAEIEINGQGETDWQRTIEHHDPALIRTPHGRRPLYMERETLRRRSDEENFFRLVQMACLNECADFVRTMELTPLVFVQGVRFPGVRLPGSRRFVLRRLRQEMGRQFSERRRTVLQLLILYLEKRGGHAQSGRVIFYGTNAMEAVWEDAVRTVFADQLKSRVQDIEELSAARRADYPKRHRLLIDIIKRPCWIPDDGTEIYTDTLIPDTVSISADTFVIYDAKYYTPHLSSGRITGQPGLESVTKQYLYQMAYADFIDHFGLKNVRNIFLLPVRHEKNGAFARRLAKVSFPLLEKYTKTPLSAILLDADAVWQAYVDRKQLSWEQLTDESVK